VAWVEVFAVFIVCHLVGDYLLQTDWQATHKRAGLGSDPRARRALASHIFTYTLAYVPAFIWLAGDLSAGILVATVALVAVPHWIQDDGRLLTRYIRAVKGPQAAANKAVAATADQSFHVLTLLLVSFLAAS
jgi:hypothetical protein